MLRKIRHYNLIKGERDDVLFVRNNKGPSMPAHVQEAALRLSF